MGTARRTFSEPATSDDQPRLVGGENEVVLAVEKINQKVSLQRDHRDAHDFNRGRPRRDVRSAGHDGRYAGELRLRWHQQSKAEATDETDGEIRLWKTYYVSA